MLLLLLFGFVVDAGGVDAGVVSFQFDGSTLAFAFAFALAGHDDGDGDGLEG